MKVQIQSDPPHNAVPGDTYEELAWEDHPYYDDLGSPETDQGNGDELDKLDHGEDQEESHLPDEAAPDDAYAGEEVL